MKNTYVIAVEGKILVDCFYQPYQFNSMKDAKDTANDLMLDNYEIINENDIQDSYVAK